VHQERDPRGPEQPNVLSPLGELPIRFWALVVVTGVGAGLGAMAFMAILHVVQHAAFGYSIGEYSAAVAHRDDIRRIVVLTVGGLVTGVGYWVLRRRPGGTGGEPTGVVWTGKGDVLVGRSLVSGALSEVSIGMGCSLGREAAPQHAGAAVGAWLSRRLQLPDGQRMLLIACGAGAGVGAVYNVPFAGALFAAELYLGSVNLDTIVPALATAAIATAVSWITLPMQAVYRVPAVGFPDLALVVFALLLGPLTGVLSAGYVKLIGWAGDHRPTGRWLMVGPVLAFAVLGVIAIEYPLLLGNGRDLAQFAFSASSGTTIIATLAMLTLLKPLVTSMCLRSGASGGLFTPTFSFGAALGAFLGHLWALLWPGAPGSSYAVVGAAAMLGAAMQAPMAATAFAIELTNTVNTSMVAILIAVVGATLVAHRLELRSIYSARLPASEGSTKGRTATASPSSPAARRRRRLFASSRPEERLPTGGGSEG